MSKLSKNEKILLTILGMAVLGYLYYTFLLNPVLNKIAAAHNNINSYKSEILTLDIKESKTKSLEKQYEDLKVKYEQVIKDYPEFQKSPQIAYDIKALANKYSITLSSINFSDAAKSESNATNKNSGAFQLCNVSLNMAATGSYLNLKAFIKSLEEQQRASEITTASLVASGSTVSSSITANYYFITDSNNKDKNSYDFNKGTYGKTDLFN